MKRIFIFVFVLFCAINLFAYEGDSLGSHKANRNLNMREHDIDNPGLVDGVDIPALATSTGTVNRPITRVIGFTDDCDFNVNDYTDASEAIQAACDATNALGGGMLIFREGIYSLAAPDTRQIISPGNNIVWMGQGKATEIEAEEIGEDDSILINHTGWKFINLSFDVADLSNANFISVTTGDFTCKDCWFYNGLNNTLLEIDANSNAGSINIINNEVYMNTIGKFVTVRESPRVRIIDNSIIGGVGDPNIYVAISSHVIISRNYIKGGGSIYITECSKAIEITENVIINEFDNGINCIATVSYLTEKLLIANNVIHGAMDVGINVDGYASSPVIEGNTVKAIVGLDIDQSDIENAQVQGNNFYGCTTDIEDGGTDSRIRNNIDKDGGWLPESDNFDMGGNDIEDVGTGTFDTVIAANIAISTGIPGQFVAFVNEAGGILKGQAVYISGKTGIRNNVSLADNLTAGKDWCDGIALTNVANAAEGIFLRYGYIEAWDTTDWSEPNHLWLGQVGNLVDSRPSSGTIQMVGVMVNDHISTGAIYVHVGQVMDFIVGRNGEVTVIRMPLGDVIDIRDAQNNTIATIGISSHIYKAGYLLGVDSITAIGEVLYLLSKTTFYGPAWFRYHDVKGIDNVEANSYTVLAEYTLPVADGNNGDVPTTDGAGTVTFQAPTGVGFTTFYFQLSGGGDVWVASNAFIPISGCFIKTPTTWTITGVKFFAVYHSTTASSWYNIAHSTDVGDSCTTVWDYIFDADVEVSTSTKQSAWQTPDTINIFAYQYLALHITAIPSAGDLPAEFGATVRYWRDDEFE